MGSVISLGAVIFLGLAVVGCRVFGRGLHSSTFQLNLSAFSGIGGAFRGCLRGVQGVVKGYSGLILCQKRLRLSCEMDEYKPLVFGGRFHACNDTTVLFEAGCTGMFSVAAPFVPGGPIAGGGEILIERVWARPLYSFDWIGDGMLTLFEVGRCRLTPSNPR